MSAHEAGRLQRLLGGAELAKLRSRLRKRYAASEPPADGFTLTGLSPAEAAALAGLLGRRQQPRASMRLSHTELDAALHGAGLAANLRQALELLDGPITDTAAARQRRRRAWADAFAQAADARLARILTEANTRGLVKRLAADDIASARNLIKQSDRVLARLPAAGIALARLAAHTLGDAHALDTGQPVSTLVRRALTASETAPRPRELWAGQGVLVNELAKPVVTLNLRATGADPGSRFVKVAAAMGEPLHLSLRLLSRSNPEWQRGQCVFVCENPEVLAAAAETLGPRCPALVSLDGQLSAAPRTLLDQLAATGAKFYYHGDFDWGGLRIANHVINRYGAMPWRFSAADYQPDDGPALSGRPVAAVWDADLSPCMQAAGVAIHEESRLDGLVADLEGSHS
jgi:uncharacterized protein (TIGR02679 family)